MRNLVSWTPRTLTQGSTFDNIFDDFFGTTATSTWTPAADIVENADHYLLELDMPGFERKDIQVSVESGALTVRGTRRSERKAEDGAIVRSERYAGQFTRSFRLGEALDTSKIMARYENGVLIVEVPKAEEARPRQIEVK